jgi:hypothetical protein
MISQVAIFTIHAELADIRQFGMTPYGERRVIDILGGRVEGSRLNGRILPGADWQIVRPDGVTDVRARYAIETDSGARILVTSDGLRHGPAEVLAALARGEAVDPARYYFRTVMRFETADPARSHGSIGSWRSPRERVSGVPCGSTSMKWCDGLTAFAGNVTETRAHKNLEERRERCQIRLRHRAAAVAARRAPR